MDFALLSTLLPALNDSVSRVLVSYDIGCQWVKNLQSRVSQYSISASLNLNTLHYWKVVIPKFHLSGHGDNCQIIYNLNYTKGVGRTDGERIEGRWSQSGSMVVWTRENGPNTCRAILDDHWGSLNWQKLLGLHRASPVRATHTPMLLVPRVAQIDSLPIKIQNPACQGSANKA